MFRGQSLTHVYTPRKFVGPRQKRAGQSEAECANHAWCGIINTDSYYFADNKLIRPFVYIIYSTLFFLHALSLH